MTYKLGKKPAREGAVKLQLSDYLDLSKLPTPPANFGREHMLPHWPDWKMLGNDTVGDCAIAGPFHALMLWNAEAGKTINVDDACTLREYSAITGYDPKDPSTDQGSDVQQVAEYWRTTGLTDDDGGVHKIDAYVALQPGNIAQLWAALYLFDGVGIGLSFPAEWQTATQNNELWDKVRNPNIEGGHYVLGVGRRSGYINLVTWGQQQLMTEAGYQEFNDETIVYLDEDKLINGKDINGFDLATLKADLGLVTKVKRPRKKTI